MRFVIAIPMLIAAVGVQTHSQDLNPAVLSGSTPAGVFDLNAAGRLVGSVTPVGDSNARATFWRNVESAPLELLLLADTNWSRAFAVNARGQIVGQIQNSAVSPLQLFAAFWESASDPPVALTGGATTAVAINGAGQIAGNIRAGTTVHAAMWTDSLSEPVDLGTFGGASSSAADLNDAGQVVGTASYGDGSQRAALWPSGGDPPIDLGTIVGASRSSAFAINERGEIVGEAFFASSNHRVALFWADAGAFPIQLASLGGASSQAVGLDNRGRIVGQAQNAAGEMRACLWPSAFEPPIDLGPGFARAINPRGVVAGELGGQAVVWAPGR
jgi:probable HAF family extracellular repeat protein